ncbi:MAG: hypothetical protein ACYSSN_09040 [Planctomycetota bacterium]
MAIRQTEVGTAWRFERGRRCCGASRKQEGEENDEGNVSHRTPPI